MKKKKKCTTCGKLFSNMKNLRWHIDMNIAMGCHGGDHVRKTCKRLTVLAIRSALRAEHKLEIGECLSQNTSQPSF